MSEVVSQCLPHRQLWVSNLSKAATQWLGVDSNLRPSSCKVQNLPLHHRVPVSYLACLAYKIHCKFSHQYPGGACNPHILIFMTNQDEILSMQVRPVHAMRALCDA